MRKLDIVMAVIKQGSLYYLQLRDGNPQIGAAGLIGCFGGKIDGDERPIDALCREVAEETNLRPKKGEVVLLGEVSVVSDHKLEPVNVHAIVFEYKISSNVKIEATEGKLVSFTSEEVFTELGRMTPGTRACFEELIGEKK